MLTRLKAYKSQIERQDTPHYDMDQRDYGIGAQILRDLGIRKIKLVTSNPKRRIGLIGYGLEIVDNLVL